MTCPNCGAPLTPGAAFCSICGRPISVADARPTTQLPDHARGPAGNAPPNPYAPGPGFAPPGPPPAPGAGPYAAPPPPGGYPVDPTYHPPGANPYGAYPPSYPYAQPAAPRRGAALLWIGVGLLTLAAFVLLCALAFAIYGTSPASYASAAEANSARLGFVVCALGALFLLGIPGAILVFVGRRR